MSSILAGNTKDGTYNPYPSPATGTPPPGGANAHPGAQITYGSQTFYVYAIGVNSVGQEDGNNSSDSVTAGPCGQATPYFSVMGGDISAGNGFGTGTCTATSGANIASWNTGTDNSKGTNYTGAGSSLGALASGHLYNFVSGMGLAGGVNQGGVAGHGLSFANTVNTGTDNYGGNFSGAGLPCVPDYFAAKPADAAAASGTFDPSGQPSGSYYSPTDITLGAANPVSSQVTLYVKGNVTITSPITLGSFSLSNLASIPQFKLVVQGNIYIAPGVGELDGTYVAQKTLTGDGNIMTCAPNGPATATYLYRTCNSQLTFVGSVAAQGTLYLNRNYGTYSNFSGTTLSTDPAETFQYSPQVWLGAQAGSNLVQNSYTSLPPVL